MSRQAGSEGRPFGESRRSFNLFNKRPSHSNRHGELREADFNDYPELKDLDIQVAFANISKVIKLSFTLLSILSCFNEVELSR